MNAERWRDLPELGAVEFPQLGNRLLVPSLLDVSQAVPPEHAVIGGVMVYLHGAVVGRQPARVTSDVDVLFDVEVMPSSLREAVEALRNLGYRVDPASPDESTHRYIGANNERVDVLAPAGVRPRPDLTTTPPGRTIEVYGGLPALRHRVVVQVTYEGRTLPVVIPDLPRALLLKVAAYGRQFAQTPAAAYKSRHLEDIAFLTAVVGDVDEVSAALGPAPECGHFAQAAVLDRPDHHAWAAAGDQVEDAKLVWDILRNNR